MTERKDQVIIFDLDGTLLDTSPGIYGSVRFTEKQMELSPVSDSFLREFVGPPPKEMYKRIYGLSEEQAMEAVRFHREYGRKKAIYEANVYEGIQDTLVELRARGFRLAVATLKKQTIAEIILERFNLSVFFDVIVGMNDEESLTKKDTIILAMKRTQADKAIMVGDSEYDYYGAVEAEVGFVGVSYGFGFNESDSYDFMLANKPTDIIEIINRTIQGDIVIGI